MKREFIRYLAGAAAGVLMAGSPAIAADLTPVPPPAPVFTWTGFELGLHVGGGSDRTSVNLYDVFNFSDSYNSTGAFGGAHVGFNYQLMGPLVIGVQGEYNFAGLIGNSSAFPLNYLATSVREFGSADARIGYAFNNNLLIYAIGGFAYGDIRDTINFQCSTPSVSSASRSTASSPPTATASMSAAVSNITSTAIGRLGSNTAITILARAASPTRVSARPSILVGVPSQSPFPTTPIERPCRPAVLV